MGRIAPRRRKTTRVYQPLLRTWLNLGQRLKPGNTQGPNAAPLLRIGKGQKIKTLLLRIWHLPDGFTWMEPLPYFHRRWAILFGAVLLLALLWPYKDDNALRQRSPSDSALQANLQGATPLQEGNWLRYQIQPGQTLAQLFRDNNLPVNDVFAMARVEGSDKPLSSLNVGQEVRIERAANGVINALSVTTAEGNEALFRRQADSSYRRVR